ncbi:MAG: T9SS type A sorting domain-containing protein, partial [Chitinophagales bacterium]
TIASDFSVTDTFKTRPMKVAENVIDDEMEIVVYPNPASDFFTIELIHEGNATIIVSTVLAEIVYERNLVSDDTGKLEVNAAEWKPGLYFVTVKDKASLQTKKITID